MPEPNVPPENGIAACERFIREMREIDLAYHGGWLGEWVEEKLTDERRAAGFDTGAGDG